MINKEIIKLASNTSNCWIKKKFTHKSLKIQFVVTKLSVEINC